MQGLDWASEHGPDMGENWATYGMVRVGEDNSTRHSGKGIGEQKIVELGF